MKMLGQYNFKNLRHPVKDTLLLLFIIAALFVSFSIMVGLIEMALRRVV